MVRPYTDADLAVLQPALAAWRAEAGPCGYCHVGDLVHRVYEGLRDHPPGQRPVRVWTDAAGVAGVAVCGRFDTAFDVFTRPALRGTEAETAMLADAYRVTREVMTDRGKARHWAVSDVHGCDETRARLLADLGFARYRVWDRLTERSLTTPPPEAVVPDGFTVRGATLDDADRLAAVRNESFGCRWTGAELRAEVLTRPGYLPERELVAVVPDGRFAAFAGTWLDEVNAVGHFEPVGTSSAFRRLGLARALLCHGLAELRRLGMTTATVEHDASNTAAGELYASLGFGERDVTYGFRRAE